MNRNYLLFCLIGILTCLITSTAPILRGTKADDDKFTYMISKQVVGRGHDCGASIIGNQHVLTAAHCHFSKRGRFVGVALKILAGTNNLNKTHSPAVKIKVVAAYIPAESTPTAEDPTGDIAVLKLAKVLPRRLKRLSLPPKKTADYDHKVAKITGFGWSVIRVNGTRERGYNKFSFLRYADADIITNEDCNREYPNATISDKEICAKVKQHREDRPRGACVGDSGGPLVYDNIVVGVLSHTPHGCSEQTQAGIYTRVSHFLSFIYDAIHHKVDDRHQRKIRWTPLPH